MQKWIITGISGCGRIEKLNELKNIGEKKGQNICVHDVGEIIYKESRRLNIPITDEKVLDMDQTQLKLLRSLAMQMVNNDISSCSNGDLHLIGTHATFRWKNRLIPGIAYQDVVAVKPDGFINIVQNVDKIFEINKQNPKWDEHSLPNFDETQNWLMEEEFVTEVLATVTDVPVYIVARDHSNDNLLDLFFSKKKKIYLSYPITAVEETNPDLLQRIQGPILKELEKLFIVFNPLTIKDMSLPGIPEFVDQLTPKAIKLLKARTIERDFQFIDQSDAVVVFYLTDKISPGVLAEIQYAHRSQKPVYMVFNERKSPFIEDVATYIAEDIDSLMSELKRFSEK